MALEIQVASGSKSESAPKGIDFTRRGLTSQARQRDMFTPSHLLWSSRVAGRGRVPLGLLVFFFDLPDDIDCDEDLQWQQDLHFYIDRSRYGVFLWLGT